MIAEKRASKSSATFSAASTATGCGRRCALSASRTVSVSPVLGEIDMRDLAERVHAGVGAAGALHHRLLAGERPIAAVSTPCTGRPSSWTCQPANGAPSYSMVSL